jgi:glycosyltransferase involved in cell wall biosynthesis
VTSTAPTVSVIIPTLNEGMSIKTVIESIPDEVRRTAEVLVVDGLSQDDTVQQARAAGAKVVHVKKRGKGRAMRVGAEIAKGDILLFIDGDNSYPARDIPRFIALMRRYDLVLGNAIPYLKRARFGEKMLQHYPGFLTSRFLFSLIGLKLDDPLNGMRAIRKETFRRLRLRSDGFEIETEMNIKAWIHGLKVSTIPISLHRRRGRSKFIFDVKSQIRICCMIFSVRRLLNARAFSFTPFKSSGSGQLSSTF